MPWHDETTKRLTANSKFGWSGRLMHLQLCKPLAARLWPSLQTGSEILKICDLSNRLRECSRYVANLTNRLGNTQDVYPWSQQGWGYSRQVAFLTSRVGNTQHVYGCSKENPPNCLRHKVCVSKALHIKGGTKNPRVLVVELDRSDIVEMACRLAPAERSIQKTRGVAVRSPFSRPRRVKIHLRSL